MLESALLEHARRRLIRRIDIRDDPLEPHDLEAVLHARERRLGRVAAAPAIPPEAVGQLPLAEADVERDTAVADELPRGAFPHAPRQPALEPSEHVLSRLRR